MRSMMSSMVKDAVERWQETHLPPASLRKGATPSSMDEAQDMRSAVVIEQKELEARMAAAPKYEREALKRKATAAMARISELNDWISKARRHSPMRASTPIGGAVLSPEMAAVLAVAAPVFPNRCTCGEEVEPERLRDSWAFYCQSCGADWSAPAPIERPKSKPR